MHSQLKMPIMMACLLAILSYPLLFAGCDDSSTPTSKEVTPDQQVERGKYLVQAADCSGCHTPGILTSHGFRTDSSRFLAGYPAEVPLPRMDTAILKTGMEMDSPAGAFAGEWGVSFPANLTPDPATGLGGWSASIFINCIRHGKYHGVLTGRSLLPPMPWRSFRNFSDEDLEAMFAYLQTLPAIHNRVPDPVPFDQINRKNPALAAGN